MPVTLAELLDSRDKRAKHQKDLLGANPGKSLLCLTVQLPGPVKRNEVSLKIAKEGVEAIRKAFSPVYEELKDLETGYEAYFLVDLPAREAKILTCQIEDTHPLGRLMDIDVLVSGNLAEENYFSCSSPKNQFSSAEVKSSNPKNQFSSAEVKTSSPKNQFPSVNCLSRTDIGLQPRRCLLCGNEVRYCMRGRTHTTGELLSKIEEMVKE